MNPLPSISICVSAVFSVGVPLAASAGPPSNTAEKWLNTLTLRPFDDRRVVVLFIGDKLTHDLKEPVAELNKLARRSDVVVLAVTAQGDKFARKFVEEFDPRFAVGIQSRAERQFDVRRYPTVMVFQKEGPVRFTDTSELIAKLGPAPADEGLAAEQMTTSELLVRVRESDDHDVMEESLSILRMRMPPEEFLGLCDELEYKQGELALSWLGKVRYARHLGDPAIPVKQSDSSPGRDAMRKAKNEGGFGRQAIYDLYRSKPEWTTEELLDPYLDNLGNSDAELVYRWGWAGIVGDLGKPAYAEALAEMLEIEPDPNVRHRIACAISDIYDNHPFQNPGFVERLERRLEREDNIRWVRPMMELAIHQLKNYPNE